MPDIVSIYNIRSLNETELLVVTASDGYSSVSTQYNINILDSFDTINLVTTPGDTSYIVYDGCKLIIFIFRSILYSELINLYEFFQPENREQFYLQ